MEMCAARPPPCDLHQTVAARPRPSMTPIPRAIASGHPIGASGARVLTTLVHEMQKRDAKKGLATLCIGGGMGVAMCLER